MVAARRIIALSVEPDQRRALVEISRSRTEPANRVERARIILAYLEEPSAYAVARVMGVSQQTVTRCLGRAAELGVLAALDDRARSGRDARITAEARTWLVGLACSKPTELGYPHELWTTRLLAAHARNYGPRAGHCSLANLAQGTVCKILAAHEVKPHKVRYYLERRDPEFEPKMAEVLCVYREVAMRRAEPDGSAQQPTVAVISYDEKPGIQAIGTVAPDRRPVPSIHPTISRDHEYKRHGTVTLMAGIDLENGQVHALVKDRHRSREFIEFLNVLDAAYPAVTAIKIILDNHSAHVSRETKAWLAGRPEGRFQFVFTPKHGSWLNLVEGFFAKAARSVLRHIRVRSKHELKQRILEFIDDLNRDPVVHRWHYQIDTAA
jgi:transposase